MDSSKLVNKMAIQTKTLTQSIVIKASPHEVYEAYMDSKKHSEFTGQKAKVGRNVGDKFSAYDGDLKGENVELIPDQKIVQLWRSDEENWPKTHFSTITIELTAVDEGTRIDFTQEKLPKKCYEDIEQGWHDYYWTPMKEYLENPDKDEE
jgi:activator of HSP90 ATPase